MLTPDEGALQAVRRRHELRVLESLIAHGNRTRRELESDTRLSRTTLSAIVSDLRHRGVISERDQEVVPGGRNGRPTKTLSLDPNAGAVVGIELGRRRIGISVQGFDGSPVTNELRDIPSSLGLDSKVELAAEMIRELIAAGRIKPEAIIGTGIGIASRHANPASLFDGENHQLDPQGATLDALRAVLPGPLLWDNNIRLAAMAYGRDSDELLYVVLSAGVSSAIVTNGTLLRGGNGIAGELGHVSVDFSGPRCWCGRHGCLESFINEANVLAEAAHRGQSFPSIAALAEAAAEGNGIAANIVDWAGELLARAMVGATVLLDPGRVVIAGELSQFGEPLLAPLRRALAEQHLDLGSRVMDIGVAPFAPTAGSDGAARMALSRWAMTSGQ
ncbi:Sugar kinase of the NBD/HSP70 family, may contain an N-terminal HTH domain [Arthrobacter alpinus]|uniref:Sugar kinase of the NBD/HSP70 family, may contain an N-terminal HTH domain n=1 Tax=Arthrobacter alpinus TaxID=656366 RepID=A0A1H5IU77_9MICC|nr:ROK family transcriptional regulator [Arthrobacter alpinus]SEE43700.1 Sugar kinase of the NBD/HSP70 family, may contain an N-terminal HTH domain [Arthrobacter alpinus]